MSRVWQACKNCRAKKMKCDGERPICGRCTSTRLALTCKYEAWQEEAAASLRLSRNAACVPCRLKKTRCDAVRPVCGKCQLPRTKSTCTYDSVIDDHQKVKNSYLKDSVEQSRLRSSRPPSQKNQKYEEADPGLSSVVIIPRRSRYYQISSTISLPTVMFDPLKNTIIKNPTLRIQDIDNTLAFALSNVSSDDLNLRFRFIFHFKRFHHGFYFPPEKLHALLSGDTSSSVLHEFFVHYAHLVGAQFFQERQGYYCVLAIQARHLRLSRAAFKNMEESDDPFAFAQANYYMGCAYLNAQSTNIGILYVRRALHVIRRNDIRFVPSHTIATAGQGSRAAQTQGNSFELARERIALLSSVILLGVILYLVGQPSVILVGLQFSEDFSSKLPIFFSEVFSPNDQLANLLLELEEQFRYELTTVYPSLISPFVSAVQSAIIVKDANNIIAWFQQQTTPSASWLSTCQIFILHLKSHLEVTKSHVTDSLDAESRVVFSFSCILSFAAYAQILFVLAMSPCNTISSAAKLWDECNDALQRSVQIVDNLGPGEFLTLEPLLGLVWYRMLALFGKGPWRSVPSSNISDLDSSLSIATGVVPFSTGGSGIEAQVPSAKTQGELAANIARITELNNEFLAHRHIPGTASLCAKLAEHS